MEKTIIDARSKSILPDFGEIFRYRQLLFSLAWRDIRVKYAQTYIGLIWAFINPIFNLAVLSFVFGTVAKVDTGEVPHLLFTIAGLSAWTYFSTLLSEAGSSIVGAQSMIKKIYFPRIVIPLSKAISGLVDFGVTLICLVALMFYYGYTPGPYILWLPLFLLLALFSGLAGGILASALSVRYRDFSFVIPMIVRLGLYATPVAYQASAVPESYKTIFYLNPMVGVVEGFRWALFGTSAPDPLMFYSIGIIFIIFIIAIIYFHKVEGVMADIL
ncbi:MAG: lipopolysaccharide transport system permease protein [Saprospiraceae bacterium]|jgi:lipopolysaccharide transport system permease protein